MRSALVNKLYCTDVYCEWVSCLHPCPADFHARVVLDGAACPLGYPGEVDDVPGVLGVDRVVPIVVRVLVLW